MFWTTLLAAWFGAVPVEIQPGQGPSIPGTLVELSSDQLTFETATGDRQVLATDQLRSLQLQPPAASSALSGSERVQLADGGQVIGTRFTYTGETASVTTVDSEQPWAIPRRSIRVVQRQDFTGEQLDQWKELLAHPPSSDALVLQRRDRQLQAIEGVIESVSEDAVRFQFDGDTTDVKLTRVVGMFFYQSGVRNLPASRATLRTVGGSLIPIAEIHSDQNLATATTPTGISVPLPWERIASIQFVTTSVVSLSDLEPEQQEYAPYVVQPATLAWETLWFAPQPDRTVFHTPLTGWREGQELTSEQGWGYRSGTSQTFRLAGEYRRLQGTVNLPPRDTVGIGPVRGEVSLRILVDGQERWQQTLHSDQQSVDLDLDMVGANRLTIRVDFGSDGDQGDYLNLREARLIK